jgi:putative transposase
MSMPRGTLWPGLPVQDDDHLVAVLRHVERNALGAEVASRAEDRNWSSLPGWQRGDTSSRQGAAPVRAARGPERVNEPMSIGDPQQLEKSVSRGRPNSAKTWTQENAIQLELESCLRPQGRPWERQS